MDWKDLIRSVAPTVAAALGTPAAGVAVKVLADLLLGGGSGDQAKDEASLAQVLNATGMTPELRARLIEAEMQVKAQAHELQKLVIQQDTTRYVTDKEDRASARQAAVDGGNAVRTFWFALLIFVSVIGIEGAVLMYGLPAVAAPELLGRILGTLDAAMLTAIYYIFGSSAGSARKDFVK